MPRIELRSGAGSRAEIKKRQNGNFVSIRKEQLFSLPQSDSPWVGSET